MDDRRPPVRHIVGRAMATRSARVALMAAAVVLVAISLLSLRANRTQPVAAFASAGDSENGDPAITCRSGRSVHVSPAGRPANPGTTEAPRDLASVLGDVDGIRPCDTVWVHEGIYRGTFTSVLNGRAGEPIVVRAWPGERVVIDSAPSHEPALSVRGSHSWFWGLELTSSAPGRVSTQSTSWPSDLPRGNGVSVLGAHNRLINLVISDLARGVEIAPDATGTEVYGCLVFHNGWEGPQGSNGHGIETRNQFGTQRLRDNVIFNQYSHGIIALGNEQVGADHLRIEGNILFNNGVTGRTGFARDILVGGPRPVQSPVLIENSTYGGAQTYVGYGSGCANGVVTGNYFVGSTPLVLFECLPRMSGNTLFGQYGFGTLPTSHPDNRYLAERPREMVIRVRRNAYEPGTAYVAVYNWSGHQTLDLDLSALGLSAGDEYEVRDVQAYAGAPLHTGTVEHGARVALPLTLSSTSAPAGLAQGPAHTAPAFAAFVIRKRQAPPTT